MAKHLKPATNGSGHLIPAGDDDAPDGRGTGLTAAQRRTLQQLEADRDALQRKIDAFHLVAAAATTQAKITKVRNVYQTIQQGITAERKRRGVATTIGRPKKNYLKDVPAPVQRVFDAVIHKADRHPIPSVALWQQIRLARLTVKRPMFWAIMKARGFVASGKGSGSIWTKADTTTPTTKGPKPDGYWTDAAVKRRRKRSATFLAKFSTTEPKKVGGSVVGAFLQRGYLRREGEGFLRTDKEFHV